MNKIQLEKLIVVVVYYVTFNTILLFPVLLFFSVDPNCLSHASCECDIFLSFWLLYFNYATL